MSVRCTLCLVAWMSAGCLPYSVVRNPAPPVQMPSAYVNAQQTGERSAESTWWQDFGDPGLNQTIDRLLSQNLQLHAAFARLSQAQAVADLAGVPQWPNVGLQASAGRQRQRLGTFGAQEFNSYSLSVPVSYEVDVFGRLGAEADAAALDALSARDEVESLAMSLVAQTVEAYYGLVEIRARRALLEEQLELNETFLELIQLRFREGLASAVDLHQQNNQVAGTRSQLELVTSQEVGLENQLAVLMGELPRAAGSREAPEVIPDLPPPPAVGIPADLLTLRPDVRAARRRVIAADERVGAAIASWFPSLRLSGSIGFSATALADLFEDLIWSAVASLTQTLVDGGRRDADVDRTKAAVQEALANYGQILLVAISEVESALVQEHQQGRYIGQLASQVEHSENNLREARTRYQQGLSDFLPVLAALTALQGVQVNLLSAQRQRVSNRVQLYRALGGTWTVALEAPEPFEVEDLDDEAEEGQSQ